MEHTLDIILREDIKICQLKDGGFRFGTDSLLLAYFSRAKKKDSILEIGAGSGVVSILIAKMYGAKTTAIELQESVYETLLRSIKLSQASDMITPIYVDINDYKPDIYFDQIISNPPYRKVGTGKVAKSDIEAVARFDIKMDIKTVVKFAKSYLKDNGRLTVSYDADMLINALSVMRDSGIEPKRLQFVHPTIDKPAKIVLVDAVKSAGIELKIEPPIIQNGDDIVRKSYQEIFSCNW